MKQKTRASESAVEGGLLAQLGEADGRGTLRVSSTIISGGRAGAGPTKAPTVLPASLPWLRVGRLVEVFTLCISMTQADGLELYGPPSAPQLHQQAIELGEHLRRS